MALSPVPYTRQVKLNYPNKVLSGSASNIVGTEYWPHPNAADDPWYDGAGITRKFYRWEITFTVEEQTHGSNLTREPFVYNGLDVTVGDWIAGSADGKCLRIVSISEKEKGTVTCIAEDYLRYNTFKSPNGNGRFNAGSIVIFSLNEEGNPIIDPLPSSASFDFYVLVTSRFAYLNPQTNYVLDEIGHNFSKGNAISVVPEGYVQSSAQTADTMIGVVTEVGPGPDLFMLLPNNKIYDFDPALPGTQGEYVYVDSAGELSNVSSTTKRPVFLILKDAEASISEATEQSSSIPNGNSIILNSVPIEFNGIGGESNTTEMAQQINNETSNHNVVASVIPFPSIAESNVTQLSYGQVGGFVPFSGYIDSGSGNVFVEFSSNTAQQAGLATPLDLKTDIDSYNIGNLVVNADEETITFEDLNGNVISLANAGLDQNLTPLFGDASITGFPLLTPQVTEDKLVLTRSDGGEILIFEDSTVFRDATGIVSSHNGRLPLAMNIEQGVRTGGIYVVADINARDNIVPLVGDQAYVTNKGDGEWGLYQYTGSEWVIIATEDSAATDARTFEETFTIPYAGNALVEVGNVSAGRKITEVTATVNNAFDGNVEVLVGFDSVGEYDLLFASAGDSDLTVPGIYKTTPDYYYPENNTQDRVIVVSFNDADATTGNITIKVTYV